MNMNRRRQASREVDPQKLFYRIWFPKNVSEINIIAPPSYEDTPEQKLTSPNYSLVDRCGDRDSIYSLGRLLSRKYPRAHVNLATSDDHFGVRKQRNLVVIGGPGGKEVDPSGKVHFVEGNSVCRLFSKIIQSNISYSDDFSSMVSSGRQLLTKFDDEGHMTKDFGYFASFRNPFLTTAKVILVHGTHTLGVLGATRLFDPYDDSIPNFLAWDSVANTAGRRPPEDFESHFEVQVSKGDVICPYIEKKDISLLNKEHQSMPSRYPEPRAQEFDVELDSLQSEIDSLIKVAIGSSQHIPKKVELQELLVALNNNQNLTPAILSKIRDRISANKAIPSESIQEIRMLIDDHR